MMHHHATVSYKERQILCMIYINHHTVIDCGDAGTPANGDTMQTNTTFGSIVNHTCNEGFNLTGEDQRECLETGNWSTPLPMCVSKLDILKLSMGFIYNF